MENFKVVDGIKNKEDLLNLTLRQLRKVASKLSVPLYSRKTKAILIDLIVKYQKKVDLIPNDTPDNKVSKKISTPNVSSIKGEVNTKVVFLPRDP